ncbi:MAG TPA: amino acid permease [Alphaproteobacteria bacterium]|jgi:amino acid transporter
MTQNLSARPRPTLSAFDGIAIVVGMVIGIGIFKLPSLVAGAAGSPAMMLLLWLAGGVVSVIGALCYAELCSAHPDAGGEYHFLSKAYGASVGFLFAWARMTVIQTGAIALVAFLTGDYAARLLPLGPHGPEIYAAATVVLLTGLNVFGTLQSKSAQKLLEIATILMLVAAIAIGLSHEGAPAAAAPMDASGAGIGLAMVFVLLTYGGWNEAAYLSAEIKDVQRNMVRIVVIGLAAVTALYLLANLAYLHVLGFEGMKKSEAIGADLMQALLGRAGEVFLSLLVLLAALTTVNATIFTGARTNYALGRDFPALGWLGRWDERAKAPVNALLAQGAISLALVGLGALTGRDFVAMVEYTAPVFWLFLLLTAASLFVFRARDKGAALPFRVPLYPVTPLIFCATALYMLHASLAYTGVHALIGVGVLAVGVPVLFWARRVQRPQLAE